MDGITATMRPSSKPLTPEKGRKWTASCDWNGRTYATSSRSGASFALCRELVAAGCPDQAMEVRGPEDRLQITIPSIHAAAGRTIEESGKVPVRAVPFRVCPAAIGRRVGQAEAIWPPGVSDAA